MDKDGEQWGIENQELQSTNNATTKEYTQSGEDGTEMDKDGELHLGTESQEFQLPTTQVPNNYIQRGLTKRMMNSKLKHRRNL
jgi:hypothetical protein